MKLPNTPEGKVEPFCCYLKPSPHDLDIKIHRTYSQILELVENQHWFPPNCHYCQYKPIDVSDFEKHVVNKHPDKLSYHQVSGSP
jgi:hypothetical protein